MQPGPPECYQLSLGEHFRQFQELKTYPLKVGQVLRRKEYFWLSIPCKDQHCLELQKKKHFSFSLHKDMKREVTNKPKPKYRMF